MFPQGHAASVLLLDGRSLYILGALGRRKRLLRLPTTRPHVNHKAISFADQGHFISEGPENGVLRSHRRAAQRGRAGIPPQARPRDRDLPEAVKLLKDRVSRVALWIERVVPPSDRMAELMTTATNWQPHMPSACMPGRPRTEGLRSGAEEIAARSETSHDAAGMARASGHQGREESTGRTALTRVSVGTS